MSGNGKGGSKAKSRYYCYCSRCDGGAWELFMPKHEAADVGSLSELELHLIRIQVLEKGVERVLFVSKRGEAPKKLANLGPKPKKVELAQIGIKLHKVVTV
ncbi:MAG: hypothetical protein A2Y67_02580 [Candidatus Buchananbacteria bacterium RBG_13_39_9]|uniref:Uncharacterized protein n=1 Tax=Candidatus Buchananbacteria bacterium RBG_13_39_9 TaxID=1797531 RepID=A0A1G1XR45_9BACT|nr:MAG: hypothetical protein A2Y67_02580 [Candidatus Buchananbacteria bacterium RBG_13_39_9]